MLERMRRESRRGEAADLLLTRRERVLRGAVMVLGLVGIVALSAMRDQLSAVGSMTAYGAWFAAVALGFPAFVVHQRNRVRRRERAARGREPAAGSPRSPEGRRSIPDQGDTSQETGQGAG